ncbi:MAG: lysophospholipid acyltransferase family protein [Bacteroidota bacterium]|nr:lysophospholipid acyltransferase family protein [Bacteroidota bacterium]
MKSKFKSYTRKQLARLLLFISGWRLEGEVPVLNKCVIIGAPHTSNWDFFFGLIYKMYYGLNIQFLMKEELFRFPMNVFFNRIGGIPVKRGQKNNLVEILTQRFTHKDNFYLALAPEGTRGRVKQWKRGFYYIATKAKVPIVLGYMDYGRKVVGVGPVFYPGNDIEKDMSEITNFYTTIQAKFPDHFSFPHDYNIS